MGGVLGCVHVDEQLSSALQHELKGTGIAGTGPGRLGSFKKAMKMVNPERGAMLD
jgi:hypothetical protein